MDPRAWGGRTPGGPRGTYPRRNKNCSSENRNRQEKGIGALGSGSQFRGKKDIVRLCGKACLTGKGKNYLGESSCALAKNNAEKDSSEETGSTGGQVGPSVVSSTPLGPFDLF